MNLHRALVETLLIPNATILPPVLAYACRDDQYEQCVLGACVCLPKVGGDDGPRGLSATPSAWRILLHAIRSLWAGTNAATWGALFDTISSGIGSGSGRPVEAALKCRSCGTRRHAPPVHMIKLTETREIRRIFGCIRTRRGKAACGDSVSRSISPSCSSVIPLSLRWYHLIPVSRPGTP
jgi:hypothetical protein